MSTNFNISEDFKNWMKENNPSQMEHFSVSEKDEELICAIDEDFKSYLQEENVPLDDYGTIGKVAQDYTKTERFHSFFDKKQKFENELFWSNFSFFLKDTWANMMNTIIGNL